jgi:hypothetical protein
MNSLIHPYCFPASRRNFALSTVTGNFLTPTDSVYPQPATTAYNPYKNYKLYNSYKTLQTVENGF